MAIKIDWRNILKKEPSKPHKLITIAGQKYLFVSPKGAYPFFANHPVLGDRTGRKQRESGRKLMTREQILEQHRGVLKAKTKRQRDLSTWTDADWGSAKQHRQKRKGKTPDSKAKGDRYMPKSTFDRYDSTKEGKATLTYQNKKKKKGRKKGKQHIPTGKKFSQK